MLLFLLIVFPLAGGFRFWFVDGDWGVLEGFLLDSDAMGVDVFLRTSLAE